MKVFSIISREEAYAAALKFFFTGKPCGKGHIAQRYTSAGNCVECLAENKKQQSIKNKVAARLLMAKKTRDGEAYVMTVPRRWQPIMALLQDILFKDDDAQFDSIGAIIEDKHQQTCKKMPLPAPPMRSVMMLTRADIMRMVDFRDDVIHDWQALDYRPEDEQGPVRVRLDHNWYAGEDVMACLRGHIPSIFPCKLAKPA